MCRWMWCLNLPGSVRVFVSVTKQTGPSDVIYFNWIYWLILLNNQKSNNKQRSDWNKIIEIGGD